MNSELYDSIIKVFKETGSVVDTAHRLNTYPIKVRRVLITEGLWSSKSSRAIATLLEEGKKVPEIAEELDMTDKNVQAYMPYSKGEYGKPDKSNDAINIANYRKRNSNIAAKIKEKKDSAGTDSAVIPTRHIKKRIMKLHLELEIRDQYLPTIRKYGKAKYGISRDILVPSDMTLLALHYLIYRAFGWEEGHLYTFEINIDEFFELIHHSMDRWRSFCGRYFRYPIGCDCYFWDDDYIGDISYRNWLKKQYTGPYKYLGDLEHYVECQQMLDRCIDDNPFFKDLVVDESTLNLYNKETGEVWPEIKEPKSNPGCGFSWREVNELLERLSVGEVLFPRGNSIDEEALDKLLNTEWDASDRDPEVIPITDSIIHDLWGTNWIVQITCVGQYDYCSGVPGYEEITEKLRTSPVCINYDGLPVLDYATSDEGYCEFLEDLHSGKPSKRDWARTMAKESGWTGYMVKPENLI